MVSAIQVTTSLANHDTKQREIHGLLEAMQQYHLTTGLILTNDEECEEQIKLDNYSYKILIQPIWKWLLETA